MTVTGLANLAVKVADVREAAAWYARHGFAAELDIETFLRPALSVGELLLLTPLETSDSNSWSN